MEGVSFEQMENEIVWEKKEREMRMKLRTKEKESFDVQTNRYECVFL